MALSQKVVLPFGFGDEVARRQDALTDDAPAIRALDDIVDAAVAARATDVHLEPSDEGGRVRWRVDGVLRTARYLPADLFDRVLSRIKLIGGLDIADKRLPQDGRYARNAGNRTLETRISSLPTIGGEKIAIRLLGAAEKIPALHELGMSDVTLRSFRRLVRAAAGFIIVCGPTGSGKTTTLYSSLLQRNVDAEQVCSVEDPVEVKLNGVAQVQVNARAGLTFASALRAILRQDPDVVMIGEMRDSDTAAAAISASLCGQLVMTTLHSRDALHAIDRLLELGVAAKSIGSAVTGILSQRLVRQLCPDCKRNSAARADAVGCEKCDGTGYRGRSGVFELAYIGNELRAAIEAAAPAAACLQAAVREGYVPLAVHASRLVDSGETSADEVQRVIGDLPVA